jgi:hypothetical protein
VGDEQQGEAESRLQIAQQIEDLALIVTSSAVVGSSAMSSLGWQASAAAISARWRRPPDSWCGYSSTPLRVRDADRLEQPMARARAARPRPSRHLGLRQSLPTV